MIDTNRPADLYELCEQTCEAIELCPTNYYQASWAESAKGRFGKEACGTAFCRAGHMVAILTEDRKTPEEWRQLGVYGYISNVATNLFLQAGVSDADIGNLFAGGACGSCQPGSTEYVARGIAGMRRFMEKWEPQLRAAKLNAKGKVVCSE